MDGWMKAREEDDGGRRESTYFDASLDDASGLFGRVTQIGQDFQSPVESSSQSPNFCEPGSAQSTLVVSLRF